MAPKHTIEQNNSRIVPPSPNIKSATKVMNKGDSDDKLYLIDIGSMQFEYRTGNKIAVLAKILE